MASLGPSKAFFWKAPEEIQARYFSCKIVFEVNVKYFLKQCLFLLNFYLNQYVSPLLIKHYTHSVF